jgi:broad specificity phosphatase PhoE
MKIVLIRHGKPVSADNPILSAYQYAHWIRRYNASKVAKNSRPQSINDEYKNFYPVSSDLKRAIHSTNIYLGKPPEKIDKLYREMEIPRYKFPFELKAWNWVYFSRVLWMFGYKGPFESFTQAKNRADTAAIKLIEMAQIQDQLVLFGHGYMNRYIRKALIKKGWVLNSKSNAYWGVTSLETE